MDSCSHRSIGRWSIAVAVTLARDLNPLETIPNAVVSYPRATPSFPPKKIRPSWLCRCPSSSDSCDPSERLRMDGDRAANGRRWSIGVRVQDGGMGLPPKRAVQARAPLDLFPRGLRLRVESFRSAVRTIGTAESGTKSNLESTQRLGPAKRLATPGPGPPSAVERALGQRSRDHFRQKFYSRRLDSKIGDLSKAKPRTGRARERSYQKYRNVTRAIRLP